MFSIVIVHIYNKSGNVYAEFISSICKHGTICLKAMFSDYGNIQIGTDTRGTGLFTNVV